MDETKFKETGGLHSGRRSRAPTSYSQSLQVFNLRFKPQKVHFLKVNLKVIFRKKLIKVAEKKMLYLA
jgi:hypothetical protein